MVNIFLIYRAWNQVYLFTKDLVKIFYFNDGVFMKWIFLLLISSLCATELRIGTATLDAEIADTELARSKGLSGRLKLKDGTGMLFVFDRPGVWTFWMKDTTIALSIGFFNSDKKLLQTIDMLPHTKGTEPVKTYRSPKETKYAIEVPMGWFKKNSIRDGDRFNLIDE